jgi:hypothetical protein
MNPPRVSLEDLIARLGAQSCKAYAVSIRGRSSAWLQARDIDPESVLIRNLEIRSSKHADDMTDSARLYVADDGCGNRYFINSNDTKPLVFLDSHDPPRIEETGLTLDEFFSTKIAAHSARRITKRTDGLTICRTDLPHRSILDPITLREWSEVATRHRDVEYRGYRLGQNPFTGEELRFASPGLAVIRWNGGEVLVILCHGRLLLENVSAGFRPFAETLAKELAARVL